MGRNMTWISTRAAAQRRPTSGNSRWRRGHRRGRTRREHVAARTGRANRRGGLRFAPGAKESRERALLQWPPSRMLRAVQSTPPRRVMCSLCRYAAAEEDNWARIGRDHWRAAPAESGRGSGAFGRRIKRMDDQKWVHAMQSATRTARRQSTAQEPWFRRSRSRMPA